MYEITSGGGMAATQAIHCNHPTAASSTVMSSMALSLSSHMVQESLILLIMDSDSDEDLLYGAIPS